jgi:limonene-1,2-epoxide hydrolase
MSPKQAAVAKLLACIEQLDIEVALTLFNENAMYQDIAIERQAAGGLEQIRFKLEIAFAELSGIAMRVAALDEVSNKVYVEREQVLQFRRGEQVELPVLAVFEFDLEGKILFWREYWDSRTLYEQLPQYYLDYLSSLGA